MAALNSIYRIQLNKEFNLTHLQNILPYLHELGISTIYASPLMQATKGSQHGYEVSDPSALNEEIGTENDLRDISNRLAILNMTWLQDIVPNHMTYDAAFGDDFSIGGFLCRYMPAELDKRMLRLKELPLLDAGTPALAGITVENFHQQMLRRMENSPLSLNASTTQNPKRGEDSRMRLNFLTAIPEEWIGAVRRWQTMNKDSIKMVEGRRAPSLHDEYLIYQALLGGLPSDRIVTDEFRERFPKYLTKALYEARTETRWDKPDAHYENACLDFASSLLAPGSDFLKDFSPFAAHVIEKSIPASLSHLLLKLTVPGVPDICQDAESWDLSFVDHYNRRPVDFNRRWEMLKSLQVEKAKGKAALAAFLSARAPEGASKLFVIQQTLRLRNMKPLLFSKGVYIPVPASASHLAFLRRYNEEWVLIVVPLIAAPPERSASIRLPDNAPHNWTNLFTGEKVQRGPEPIFCAEKSLLPVALYTAAAASPEAARRVH